MCHYRIFKRIQEKTLNNLGSLTVNVIYNLIIARIDQTFTRLFRTEIARTKSRMLKRLTEFKIGDTSSSCNFICTD